MQFILWAKEAKQGKEEQGEFEEYLKLKESFVVEKVWTQQQRKNLNNLYDFLSSILKNVYRHHYIANISKYQSSPVRRNGCRIQLIYTGNTITVDLLAS